MPNRKKTVEPTSESGNAAKLPVSGSLRAVMEFIQKLNEMENYMVNNKDFSEDEFIEISRALRGAKKPLKEWCARNDR